MVLRETIEDFSSLITSRGIGGAFIARFRCRNEGSSAAGRGLTIAGGLPHLLNEVLTLGHCLTKGQGHVPLLGQDIQDQKHRIATQTFSPFPS